MSLRISRALIAALVSLPCVTFNATAAGDTGSRPERRDPFASGQGSQADNLRYPALLQQSDPFALHVSASWQRQRPGAPEPALTAMRPEWTASVSASMQGGVGRGRFDMEVMKAARQAGIDPALVHAVIRVESAYKPHAMSPKGAVGLMQVIPATGRRFGIEDLLQPSANISAGTQYLSHLMRLFEGDVRLALAAYNAGENAVLRHGRRIPPYPETLRYVPRVLSVYQALSSQPSMSVDQPDSKSSIMQP